MLIVGYARLDEALRHVYAQDPDLEVVGSASGVDSDTVALLQPDVVVIDLDDLTVPIEAAVTACEAGAPEARVIVLSAQSRVRTMQRALSARAAAYVLKDKTPAALIEIVHSVARGDFYADPRLAGSMLRKRVNRASEPGELSGREHEIVRLITEGLSNREIGRRLGLSEKTVKNHVSHILAKLKVTARSGVAVFAVRSGIVG
jgi:RNA polymerase sigma factor (sigma-70 family)